MLLRSAFCMLVLALAAHAAGAQTEVRQPTRPEIRLYARLLAMGDSRRFDRSLVDSAMASRWPPLRRAGALAIGQAGRGTITAGAPLLRGLLDDMDSVVASNAAYALGLLRDSASVSALAGKIDGARARVAREAAWALGEIGAPARAAIVGALDKPKADDATVIQLLLAATKLRPVPLGSVRPYLLEHDRPSVLWAATYAIARFRVPGGVRDLIAVATRPDFIRVSQDEARLGVGAPRSYGLIGKITAEAYVLHGPARQRVRAEVARGLSLQAAGDSLDDLAITVLFRLAGDAHPHVRINALRSLATYDVRAASVVVAATSDPDANVRITAAQSLGTVLDSTASRWAPLWDRDTLFTFRAGLLASAARAGARLEAHDSWSTHRNWQYRAAALSAAGAARDPARRIAAARTFLRDPDGRVRATAYSVLAGADSVMSKQVRDDLLAALDDPDMYARAAAIASLSRRPFATEVPLVLRAYRRSLDDDNNDARIAAIGYVAAAWKRDSAAFSPAVREELAQLRPSGDPLVRAAADSVSILPNWFSRSGNPRALSWYDNVVRTIVVPALRGRTQRATIRTDRGDIELELFGADAPLTVLNFMNLARRGYYNGVRFHRVVPNFVAQDGDPRGDGSGGPGYAIRDEMNPRRYERGIVGMALSGPDTGGSQYFITHSPQPHLDGHYTIFGRVMNGFAVLDALVQGDPIRNIRVR